MSTPGSLAGWRVLVPRGGRWGDDVAARLRALGAAPVVAPLVNFAGPTDPAALLAALGRLQAGEYDWLMVSSATTVDVLVSQQVTVPPGTRVVALGDTTAAALSLAGYRVDADPRGDGSVSGLVRVWPREAVPGRALYPHAETPDPTLITALERIGFVIEPVGAYRTVGVPVNPAVAEDVRAGRIGAVLVPSGSVARQIAEQLAPLPESTIVAVIAARTAFDTRAAGLPVHAIAEERTADALVEALAEYLG